MAQSHPPRNRENHFVTLSSRRISNLDDARIHKSARVLNLNDNCIQDLTGIDFFNHITVLYLVNNGIDDMKPLANLPNLKKLFLGFNYISRLEGLEKCHELKELFIGSQRIQSSFSFSPSTITFLTYLKSMDISRNHVGDIVPLVGLKGLEHLDVSFNELRSFNQTFPALKGMTRLTILDCSGNPVVSHRRFREELHAQLPQLRILNGKDIHPTVINYYSYVNKLNSFQSHKLENNLGNNHPRFQCRINSIDEDSAESKKTGDNSQYHNWRKLTIKVQPKQTAVDECLRMIAESLPSGFRSVVSSTEFYMDHLSK